MTPYESDGPSSPLFRPLKLEGNVTWEQLTCPPLSEGMEQALANAPRGTGVSWGIPFSIEHPILLTTRQHTLRIEPCRARWLVFMHTSDLRVLPTDAHGLIHPMRGQGMLNEHAATYVILYEDGTEVQAEVRRRHQIGSFQRIWGENCFQAVAHHKPFPVRAAHEQMRPGWGHSQTRVAQPDAGPWINWLWAWENPRPEATIVGLRLEPVSGVVLVSALSAGDVLEHPLRWRARRKALLTLPEGQTFQPELDEHGCLAQLQLDLGQVISAQPRLQYPEADWETSYNNQLPLRSEREVIVEYTSHPEACFHLTTSGRSAPTVIPVVQVESRLSEATLRPIPPAQQRVTLRAVERTTGATVPVKLHVHGTAGEYLAPLDRHRIVNPSWFEDYSVDFAHQGLHQCTYIPGETRIDLPLGRVYIEISKGFEIRPVRKVVNVTPETEEITIEIERVLPWRTRGWVTADTHVHFLSPMSARLEGAAEGVNIVNLLASQWGELMTNVGDFDGQTTWGSREAGGDGEYMVRMGTENRQHVLGHISLLGYRGRIIAPMTTGGPDESALGDPIEILLTEWARQCHRQGGLVVLPHFPNPRAEHAASIISADYSPRLKPGGSNDPAVSLKLSPAQPEAMEGTTS